MKNIDYIGQTAELVHHKITIPLPWNLKCGWTLSYFIAVLPNQETFIHSSINREKNSRIKSDGYGGAFVEFLMDGGEIERIMGPYYEYYPHNKVFEYIEELATDEQKERLSNFLARRSVNWHKERTA